MAKTATTMEADGFGEILKRLRAEIAPEFIKQREGWRDRNGNVHYVDYVEWHTVAGLLDQVCPHWSHTVRLQPIGDVLIATVALTIDGVTREGVGCGTLESEMGIKKAEHDALKRAAVKFGVARALYQKEAELETRAGSYGGGGGSQNPVATGTADLITDKQIWLVNKMAGELGGLDVEAYCAATYGCEVRELSKKGASLLIDAMKAMQDQQGGDFPTHSGAPATTAAPPRRQPTQAANGERRNFATEPQLRAITNMCVKRNELPENVALMVTDGREDDISKLSVSEASDAIQYLNGLD